MIKQYINLDNKWLIIVYYNIDYNQFYYIEKDLLGFEPPVEEIDDIYHNLITRKAKAVTCNNKKQHKSIVLFNTHESKEDYISSLVHEAKHIVDDIMKEYDIINYGEPPAYTIGYIVKKMYSCLFRCYCC